MSEQASNNSHSNLKPEMRILLPSTLVILAIALPSIIWPEASKNLFQTLNGAFTANTGSLYLWISFIMVCLSVYFIFSRHGDIKFGEPDEKPEFGNFGWIAMMFCTGVAGAVMFWSIVEPLWDLVAPPQYAQAMSTQAYEWSLAYVLFHWGPLAWPWYVITSLPICFMFYKFKKPILRISSAAEPLLGEKRVRGPLGLGLETFFVVGLVFSNAAVMGISIPIVNHALASTFNVEPTRGMELGVILVSTAIFCTSLYLGLKKGIQRLSNLNVIIALCMIVFAFLVGPTRFILDTFTNSVGVMLDNYFKMQFWTDPFTPGQFPQDWTVFYALFMASYGPVMGLFIARISRGRTVRQIVSMGILGGMAGAFMIHGVFGSYTLNVQLNGIVDAVGILKESGGPAAMVAVLKSLPLGVAVLLGYSLFSTIFLATSVDSCAYVISAAVTTELHPSEEPTRGHRLYWALLQGGLGVSLLMLGGLGSVRVFANFSGALMVFPIALAVISLFIMLKSGSAWNKGLSTEIGTLQSSRIEQASSTAEAWPPATCKSEPITIIREG